MIEVIPKSASKEDFEKAMSQFKKKINNSGILQELKDRRYFKKSSEKRKEKKRKAMYNMLNEKEQ